jgi:hypothetical protein
LRSIKDPIIVAINGVEAIPKAKIASVVVSLPEGLANLAPAHACK